MKIKPKNVVDPMIKVFILNEEWKLECKLRVIYSSQIALILLLAKDEYDCMIDILTFKNFSPTYFSVKPNKKIFIFLFIFFLFFFSSKQFK